MGLAEWLGFSLLLSMMLTSSLVVRHLLQAPPLPALAREDGGAQTLTVLDYGTPLAARENGPTIGWVPVYARVALLDMQGNWVKVRILPPSVATWTSEPVAEPWLRIRSLDNVPNSLPNRWFGGEPLTATVVLPSQPPPVPQPADTPAPGTSKPPPSLVLYSLYMHLADGATYDAKPNIPRPKWWPKTLYRAGNKTTNKWTLNGKLIQGLMVRTAPASANGNEIGILVRESEIDVEPIAGNPKWGVVRNIITGSVATRPDGARITSLPATGYVFLKELDEFRTPEVFDSIEIPTVPIPINMGDVIGHIGQQVSSCETLIAGQSTSRPTLHLEVFSAQDVPAFLRDSRRYADELPERHWTLIRLRKGDPVRAEPKDEAPSVTTMAGDRTIAVTRDTIIRKDDQDQGWVCVKVHATGGPIVQGWAKDKDRRCTPWHWPDAEVVDAASNDAGTWWEGTAQVFVDFLRGGPRPMETPFFKRIRQLVDSNQDGQLSEEELDSALKDRVVARRLGGLIAYHSSEWHVPSWASKYGVISDIAMALGKKAMDNVKAEKDCVMRLRWWDEVASTVGLPESAKVYHFHPIGLATALAKSGHPTVEIDGLRKELKFLYFNSNESIVDSDYEEAAKRIGCEVAAIKAVAISETGNTGSYYQFENWDSVPAVLFERHYFHRLTGGVYDQSNPTISNSSNGGYGKYTAQYKKLLEAYALNRSAALKSASWGKFQIMGENFRNAGYSSVEDFVYSISISEKNHLRAFVSFILASSILKKAIIEKDWLTLAVTYNGPAQDGYSEKMRYNYEALTQQ